MGVRYFWRAIQLVAEMSANAMIDRLLDRVWLFLIAKISDQIFLSAKSIVSHTSLNENILLSKITLLLAWKQIYTCSLCG